MSKNIFYDTPQQSRTGWPMGLGVLALAATTSLGTVILPVSASPLTNIQPVPGYVAPVTETPVAPYVDDTRGVYVPAHAQLREKTQSELDGWATPGQQNMPLFAQSHPNNTQYQQALNTVADGVPSTSRAVAQIADEPGILSGARIAPVRQAQQARPVQIAQNDYYNSYNNGPSYGGMSRNLNNIQPAEGPSNGADLSQYPSLATGGSPAQGRAMPAASNPMQTMADGGVELATTSPGPTDSSPIDMQNGMVHLKEERITVRRALQRMMDQIGGGSWTVVWDLDESNAGLPDMEISIYADEPFIKVLNALLARLQTRSGQPIRVIKYDQTHRLVITDRTGGDAASASVGGNGGKGATNVTVDESMLKQHLVTLHYDEIPLVDALENIVNQAGEGQWRLRMYAGADQVLKPAHVEEPFSVAIDRILKIFNLRYEIFPGGKLIVVTAADSFGFRGVQ